MRELTQFTIPQSPDPTGQRSGDGLETMRVYFLLRMTVGVILLSAAFVKAASMASTPAPIAFPVIVWECILGAWFLSGIQQCRCSFLGILTFAVFASYALMSIAEGESSCGCMGAFEVSAFAMFTIDVGAIALLVMFSPRPVSTNDFRPAGTRSRSLAVVSVLAPTVAAAAWFSGARIDDAPAVVLLEEDLQRLKDKVLPFIDAIESPRDLSVSAWNLVFVRENCRKCDEAANRLLAHASLTDAPGNEQLAIVAIPPSTLTPHAQNTQTVRARLQDRYRWIISPPVLIRVENSVVTDVFTGPELMRRLEAGSDRGPFK